MFRYLGFVDLHMDHLPRHLQSKLEVLRSTEYPGFTPVLTDLAAASARQNNDSRGTTLTLSPPTSPSHVPTPFAGHAESRLLRAVYPHSAVLNPSSNIHRKLGSYWRKEDYDPSFYDTLDAFKMEEAVSRLQVWARSVLVARRALKILESYIEDQGLKPPANATDADKLDADGWAVKRKDHLRRSLYASTRPRSYFRVFYILSASRIRTALRDQRQLQSARAAFVRSIIDDALEQAMIYCIRNDNYQLAYAYRRSAVADAGETSPFANHRGSSGDYSKGGDGKKSLSSRIFAGFGGSSSKGDMSPATSTSTASASAAAVGATASGEPSPGRPLSTRSHSPVPKSLMGRLLGGHPSK
jgi:hypothetical protein